MTSIEFRSWNELHEAAKKLYKKKGFVTLISDSQRKLVAGEFGVHGSVGGLVFGTNMDKESDLSRSLVDKMLQQHGY